MIDIFPAYPVQWLGGEVNFGTLVFTWITMAAVIFFVWLSVRRLGKDTVPSRLQVAIEMMVDAFDELNVDSLREGGRKYLPFMGGLFLFIWASNMAGVVYGMEEPTRDLNTPIACGIIVLLIAHTWSIKRKGIGPYLKGYCEPIFFFFPMNVIGEIAKGISLTFRLFGNIFGGAVLVAVLSWLLGYAVLPPLLFMFFGVFVGTIQALVFAMLAMTYTAVAIIED